MDPPSSSKPAITSPQPLLPLPRLLLCLFCLPLPSFEDPCGYTGFTHNPRYFSYFVILNLITPANPLLPCTVARSQVLGMRTWTSLRDHCSVCHTVCAPPWHKGSLPGRDLESRKEPKSLARQIFSFYTQTMGGLP